MPDPLWTARLNPDGPGYAALLEIFPDRAIPLLRAASIERDGPHGRMRFYQVDVKQLSREQIDKVVAFTCRKFNLSRDDVLADLLGEHGFPVREENVVVAYSLRAFI